MAGGQVKELSLLVLLRDPSWEASSAHNYSLPLGRTLSTDVHPSGLLSAVTQPLVSSWVIKPGWGNQNPAIFNPELEKSIRHSLVRSEFSVLVISEDTCTPCLSFHNIKLSQWTPFSWFGLPQTQTLRQGFGCRWSIWVLISENTSEGVGSGTEKGDSKV